MADRKQTMARTIEKIVRKDLDSSAQLPFQILLPENEGLPPQSLLTGMVSGAVRAGASANSGIISLIGPKELKPCCFVSFSLEQPRYFELQVFIHNPLGSFLVPYRLAYAVPLRKAVRGSVNVVVNPKTSLFSKRSVSFTGESETSARLNSSLELLTLANKIAITSVTYGKQVVFIDLCCQILPRPEGALLVAHTLERAHGLRGTYLAAEVLQLAAAIETRL